MVLNLILDLKRKVVQKAYVNREYNDNSIYQEYNGKGLISDIKKQKFTDDDFEEAVAELGGNFCKERIDDVKKLSKIVYGNKQEMIVMDNLFDEFMRNKKGKLIFD